MKTRIARRIFPAIVLLALLLAGVKTASASVPMTFQGSYDVLIPGGPKGTFEYLSVYVNYKGAMVGSDNNEGQFYSEQKMLRMTGNGKTIVGELDSCGMYYVGAIRNDSDQTTRKCVIFRTPANDHSMKIYNVDKHLMDSVPNATDFVFLQLRNYDKGINLWIPVGLKCERNAWISNAAANCGKLVISNPNSEMLQELGNLNFVYCIYTNSEMIKIIFPDGQFTEKSLSSQDTEWGRLKLDLGKRDIPDLGNVELILRFYFGE